MVNETFVDSSPSQIPRYKWTEIAEEEYKSHIINSIRDEIIDSAMEAVSKSYFINKSVSFVVNCAHVSWLQLFNWMDLECNYDDNSMAMKSLCAEDGKRQYDPVPPDNWIFGTVEIRKKSGSASEQNHCIETCEQVDASYILPKHMKQ